MRGDEARSAQLFASMAEADPADRTIGRRAIATAIQSGQPDIAIALARKIPAAEPLAVARAPLRSTLLDSIPQFARMTYPDSRIFLQPALV